MQTRATLLTIFVLLACSLASIPARGATATPASPPHVAFEAHTIVVSGATPGGKVVFFGISWEFGPVRPSPPTLVRRIQVLDADAAGVVRVDLGREPAPAAVWAAVDLTTGGHVASPTEGYSAHELPVTEVVKKDNPGQLRKLEWPASELEALLVRPGEAIWRINGTKASDIDENAAVHGTPLRVDVGAMKALRGSDAAPAAFKPGDVLVLIDPRWLQYAVVEVGK